MWRADLAEQPGSEGLVQPHALIDLQHQTSFEQGRGRGAIRSGCLGQCLPWYRPIGYCKEGEQLAMVIGKHVKNLLVEEA